MKKVLSAASVILLMGAISVFLLYHRQPTAHAQPARHSAAEIYRQNCAACHGEKGDGKGPEAHRLTIKPRDFTEGIYKFRSTPSGSLPLDQDIFRSISRGVRTTGMLAQLHLSEKERWAMTEYLKSFSQRFETETIPAPLSIPTPPRPDDQLVAVGKRMYAEAGCNECHGSAGKGDGPSAKDLKDDWGRPTSPTDLTLKPFKSGPEPEDLYRTVSTGLNGTPMPSYGDVLSEKERWSLVYYILSIATRERPRGMMGLIGEEVQGMRIDMRAAMAGMMGGSGMMRRGGGMMDRGMGDMMKDMMRRKQ